MHLRHWDQNKQKGPPFKTVDLVTFPEEILNGKLLFCEVPSCQFLINIVFRRDFKSTAHGESL